MAQMTQEEYEIKAKETASKFQAIYRLTDGEIAQAVWNAELGMESEPFPGSMEECLAMFGNYLEAQISSKNY